MSALLSIGAVAVSAVALRHALMTRAGATTTDVMGATTAPPIHPLVALQRALDDVPRGGADAIDRTRALLLTAFPGARIRYDCPYMRRIGAGDDDDGGDSIWLMLDPLDTATPIAVRTRLGGTARGFFWSRADAANAH